MYKTGPTPFTFVFVAALSCFLLLGCGSSYNWRDIDNTISEQYPGIQTITPDELEKALTSGRSVILLDTRSEDEFAVSHLHGAKNVNDVLGVKKLLDESVSDTLVVAYCSVGYRSSQLIDELQKQGVMAVKNLKGSIFGWVNEGRPVYRGEREVKTVHPFNSQWGQLLNRDLWSSFEES